MASTPPAPKAGLRPRARAARVALALLGVGCQDYLFDQKCPEAVRAARVTQPAVEVVKADILFVIDNSGSMADEQENLIRNFDAFIGVLAGGNLDYRIAVTTTDLGEVGTSTTTTQEERTGDVRIAVDESSAYRPVDSFDRSDCRALDDVRHGCFRTGSRERPWIQADDGRDAVVSAFAESARVGTCGSGLERGTAAMIEALRATRPGGCNEGFLRDDANLVVIVVTDEEDFRPLPPEGVLARLAEVKPIERVRFALIGGIVDGRPSPCGTSSDGTATGACGGLCSMSPPSPTSQGACPPDGACAPFFLCDQPRGGGALQCLDLAYVLWNLPPTDPSTPPENLDPPRLGSGEGCDSCSFFQVDDCCSADVPAERYLAFAAALEQRAVALTSTVVDGPDGPMMESPLLANGCQGADATSRARPVCLVDSICQSNFSATLERIARDLVAPRALRLDPPASYPPGVVVRILAPGGEVLRVLEQGVDYVVASDGSAINLLATNLAENEGETLDVLFTAETTVDAPRVGACAL